ncbi:MAG: SPFH domain-containing protein, partial [Clostridia bacterium]|nr:SPFH domain-containing protein [Clostridia bacterium]
MEEKILLNKKNGMLVLVISTLVYVAACVGLIFGGISMETDGSLTWLFVASAIYLCIGWLPWLGLKVLNPQEALV